MEAIGEARILVKRLLQLRKKCWGLDLGWNWGKVSGDGKFPSKSWQNMVMDCKWHYRARQESRVKNVPKDFGLHWNM